MEMLYVQSQYLQQTMTLQISEKDFRFLENLVERYSNGKLMKVNKVMKELKISSDCYYESYFKNP